MKLEISPLLLSLFYISGADPKESKARIYTTSFSYLSVTKHLWLVVGRGKWFRWGWSPTSLLCYLCIHSMSEHWEMALLYLIKYCQPQNSGDLGSQQLIPVIYQWPRRLQNCIYKIQRVSILLYHLRVLIIAEYAKWVIWSSHSLF